MTYTLVTESLVTQSKMWFLKGGVQIYEEYNIQNYNLACHLVWV
jgi:hypothetical protein